jgi:chorismate dehydratase
LSFVFAAWISNKKLDDQFIDEFNKANLFGLSKLDDVVREHPYEIFNLPHYYKDCISFDLDKNKRKGLELFLKMIEK